MKCKKCGGKPNKFRVEVEGTHLPGKGYECGKCGNILFDKEKGRAIVEDLKKKELPALQIKQKVVKLSKDRLGFYFNKDIARCAALKPGAELRVSLLDKKHLLLIID